MKPLAGMAPINHPRLGIESFASLLRRLASVYGVSLFQMLRYLCESQEVAALVSERPFRASVANPRVLNSYAPLVGRLTRRVEAATGVSGIAGTTLLRIGPAFAKNGMLSLAAKRQYCPECIQEMRCGRQEGVWEPLLWGMPMVTYCHEHGVPLCNSIKEWRALDPLRQSKKVRYQSPVNHSEAGHCKETLRLMQFCADDPSNVVPEDSIRKFLNAYIEWRHLTVQEFMRAIGYRNYNLYCQLNGTHGFALKTAFTIAQRLAVSLTDILSDPIHAAKQNTLFEIKDHAQESKGPAPKRRPHRAKKVHDALLARIRSLLASDQPLPPLAHVCHARGVSTGYARYRMSREVNEYLERRLREFLVGREGRNAQAETAVRKTLRDAPTGQGRKRIERDVRAETGLAKHVVSRALRKVRQEQTES